jgi:hypothetical protein
MRKITKLARIAGTVALAGAAATAALAMTPGTFGGFTSTTVNPNNSVQAGTLTMANTAANAAVVTATTGLALDNMKPGDVASGSVTITNSGTLPADMTLAIAGSNNFPTGDLVLTIKDGSTVVYSGAVTNVSASALGSTWAAGESHTSNVTVELLPAAGNTPQGKTASYTLNWAGAQH